jgi:hypothetical protein
MPGETRQGGKKYGSGGNEQGYKKSTNSGDRRQHNENTTYGQRPSYGTRPQFGQDKNKPKTFHEKNENSNYSKPAVKPVEVAQGELFTMAAKPVNFQGEKPRNINIIKAGKYEGGKRSYFFDIQKTDNGDTALTITQTRNDNGRIRRDTIMVFEDHVNGFLEAMTKAAEQIKKKE